MGPHPLFSFVSQSRMEKLKGAGQSSQASSGFWDFLKVGGCCPPSSLEGTQQSGVQRPPFSDEHSWDGALFKTTQLTAQAAHKRACASHFKLVIRNRIGTLTWFEEEAGKWDRSKAGYGGHERGDSPQEWTSKTGVYRGARSQKRHHLSIGNKVAKVQEKENGDRNILGI